MKFQGDVASIPVTDVAQNLSTNKKSGVLTVFLEDQVRRITFRDGRIVSYTDDAGFSILEWIEEKQLIAPDGFVKALRRYKRSRRKGLGDILEDCGLPKDVYVHHLYTLVNDMLCETFSFRQGTFEFVENAADEEAHNREIVDAGIEVPVNEVLMEAARRMDEWVAIRKSLPSENDIYRVQPTEREMLLMELEGDDIAQAAVHYLDGTRSIREVLALIPATRFEASRAIAQLVSRQVARPVDGTELVAQVDQAETPTQRERAMVRLKAALEREPGNRVLLQKLAEFSHAEGKNEESAVYHKLLAQQLREANDVEGAERELRRSLKLNPKDISTWPKLYELLEIRNDNDEILGFGTELAKNHRQLGFHELARDHLARMLGRFPAAVTLRFEYADTLFAAGDRNGAVEHLLDLAREQIQKGEDANAEQTLAKVIEYDSHHAAAREIYDQIRSGELERRRERRRLFVRTCISAALLASICFFIGYDFYVRREFALTMRQVFAAGMIERGEYDKAIRRLEASRDRHPVSLLQFLEARECLEGLREAAQRHAPQPVLIKPAPRFPPDSSPRRSPKE